MKTFRFVSLAGGASSDVVLDQAAHVGEVEVVAEAVHGALHTLVAVLVHGGHDFRQ